MVRELPAAARRAWHCCHQGRTLHGPCTGMQSVNIISFPHAQHSLPGIGRSDSHIDRGRQRPPGDGKQRPPDKKRQEVRRVPRRLHPWGEGACLVNACLAAVADLGRAVAAHATPRQMPHAAADSGLAGRSVPNRADRQTTGILLNVSTDLEYQNSSRATYTLLEDLLACAPPL